MAVFSINGYDSYSGCDIIVTAGLSFDGKETTYFTLGSLQTLSVSTHQDKRPVRSLGNINAKDYVMGQRTIAGSLVFAVFDRHFADRIMKAVNVTMPDEIPALNLTINFANEYGRSSKMAIYGVKLINEGQVMSINDLYTENTYQFVALGMDYLTSDQDEDSAESMNKKPTGGIINPSENKIELIEDEEFKRTGGRAISAKLKNDSDYSNKGNIILTSYVEQPALNEDTGIVTLFLTPNQGEGTIYINNLIDYGEQCALLVDGSLLYHVELPVGYYNAIYMNTTRTRESNIEKIVVKRQDPKANKRNTMKDAVYPIIENITNSSIAVSVYDNAYTTIVCRSSGELELAKPNNGKIVTFNDLRPNTKYSIHAFNEHEDSNEVTVRTFADKNTYYEKFCTYITSNKNLLQNDYSSLMSEINKLLEENNKQTKEWVYDTILEGIIKLDDSLMKQELILLGMQFENSMLEAFNAQNPHKLDLIRNDIFDTNILVNNWSMTKYYLNKDNKLKLEGVITPEKGFSGRPNSLYSLYGINENVSTSKKYLSVFTSEGKEFLSKYRNVNRYKELDLNQNKDAYPFLDLEELYAVTIRDNHLCDKLLLEEPYLYERDSIIYADVNYDSYILLDSVYYLCVTEIYNTLDVMPYRKVAFNRQTKTIDLTSYYIPFDKDKIYHAWIENEEGNIISKTFIFNYKESIGLTQLLNKELLNELNTKKRLLLEKIPNGNNMLIDVINDLYSSTVPMKDLDTKLEYTLLEYGINSYYVSNPMESVLFETVLVNNSHKLLLSRSNEIDINKSSNTLKVTPSTNLNVKVITKAYDLTNKETVCNIYNTNNFIDIKGDYMAVLLINEHIDKVLGIVVLDSNNYKYRATGFNVKVGDN